MKRFGPALALFRQSLDFDRTPEEDFRRVLDLTGDPAAVLFRRA